MQNANLIFYKLQTVEIAHMMEDDIVLPPDMIKDVIQYRNHNQLKGVVLTQRYVYLLFRRKSTDQGYNHSD